MNLWPQVSDMDKESKLFIKGMVCNRCIMVIEDLLKRSGLVVRNASLGEVTVMNLNKDFDVADLSAKLSALGFTLLEDKKVAVINKLKGLVAEVYSGTYDFPDKFRFSDLVIQHLHKDYDSVSSLFSLVERKTIERYILDYRIERVKEFLVYTTYTLSEIAIRLNFSSIAHLSRQFKQFTGLTPSHFKEVQKTKSEVSSTTD